MQNTQTHMPPPPENKQTFALFLFGDPQTGWPHGQSRESEDDFVLSPSNFLWHEWIKNIVNSLEKDVKSRQWFWSTNFSKEEEYHRSPGKMPLDMRPQAESGPNIRNRNGTHESQGGQSDDGGLRKLSAFANESAFYANRFDNTRVEGTLCIKLSICLSVVYLFRPWGWRRRQFLKD